MSGNIIHSVSTDVRPSWSQGFARNPNEAKYPYLWKGLEVYWNFMLGATGLTAHDIAGRGNDGTLINDPIWVPSGGLTFDGTNYVDHGHVNIPNDFTVMARCELIKPATRSRVINFYDASSGRRGEIELGNDYMYLTYSNTRYGRWTYSLDGSVGTITGVSNGVATPDLYVNGVDQGNPNLQLNPSDDDYDGLRIGTATRIVPELFYTGTISFGALWSRALTVPEIELLSEDNLAITRLKTKIYALGEISSSSSSSSSSSNSSESSESSSSSDISVRVISFIDTGDYSIENRNINTGQQKDSPTINVDTGQETDSPTSNIDTGQEADSSIINIDTGQEADSPTTNIDIGYENS